MEPEQGYLRLATDHGFEGLVVQHGANRYLVEIDRQGRRQVWACSIAGRLRQGRRKQVRLAVIGDRVWVEPVEGPQENRGLIVEVLPRRNRISRPAPSGGARQLREQLVMANLDRIWVIASVAQPSMNLHFVDRVFAAATHQEVAAGLILNKLDLVEEEPTETAQLYRGLGIPVLLCSTVSGRGIEDLRGVLSEGIEVLVGLSGVGKTSLLGRIEPGLELRISEVGSRSGQGRHTTTVSRLYSLNDGGYLADTPGMREFGLWGMVKSDLSDCFVEFSTLAQGCRFRDCLHRTEPGCAVREAVERGEIDAGRYRRYLHLLEELPARLEPTGNDGGGGRR